MPQPAIDDYKDFAPWLTMPARNAANITPDDNNNLAHVSRGIICGTAGNVAAVPANGTAAVVYPALIAGILYPFAVSRINLTNTTATGITVVW